VRLCAPSVGAVPVNSGTRAMGLLEGSRKPLDLQWNRTTPGTRCSAPRPALPPTCFAVLPAGRCFHPTIAAPVALRHRTRASPALIGRGIGQAVIALTPSRSFRVRKDSQRSWPDRLLSSQNPRGSALGDRGTESQRIRVVGPRPVYCTCRVSCDPTPPAATQSRCGCCALGLTTLSRLKEVLSGTVAVGKPSRIFFEPRSATMVTRLGTRIRIPESTPRQSDGSHAK
jgi:hypothetical protein